MKLALIENNKLIQIGQTLPIKFAFANYNHATDEIRAIMPLVLCRDFLLDTIYANHHPDKLSEYTIYGMTYDVTKNPLDLKNPYLIVKFPNLTVKNHFHKQLVLLHNIEKFNEFKLTKVHTTNDKYTIVLEFSPWWIKTCLTVNVYTLLIKLISYKYDLTKALLPQLPVGSIEYGYIYSISIKFFEFVLQNLRDIVKNTKYCVDGRLEFAPIDVIHNNSGIVFIYRDIKYNANKSYLGKKLSKLFSGFQYNNNSIFGVTS